MCYGENVDCLKKKIRIKEGIDVEDQKLILEGVQLRDEVPLAAYDLKENSIIHLAIKKKGCITIYVKCLNGKTLTVFIKPSVTIEYLKMMIQNILYLPVWSQKLIFDGHELNNQHVLSECNVEDTSMIHLTFKLRNGMFIILCYLVCLKTTSLCPQKDGNIGSFSSH